MMNGYKTAWGMVIELKKKKIEFTNWLIKIQVTSYSRTVSYN